MDRHSVVNNKQDDGCQGSTSPTEGSSWVALWAQSGIGQRVFHSGQSSCFILCLSTFPWVVLPVGPSDIVRRKLF